MSNVSYGSKIDFETKSQFRIMSYKTIFMYLFVFHLYINFISRFTKKFFQIKMNLKLLLCFGKQKFVFDQNCFPFPLIKNIKKEKLKKVSIMWINLINVLDTKNIFIEEYNKKNLQEKYATSNKNDLEKKFFLLKKYEKFYRQYLRTSLLITNNLFVWMFPEIQKKVTPFIYNIILLKNINYWLFEVKFLKDRNIVCFTRKIVNKKFSVSRAFLLSHKKFFYKII